MGRAIIRVLLTVFVFAVPAFAAEAESFDAKVRSAQYDKLTAEIFGAAETMRSGETLAEVYGRLEGHMGAEEQARLAPFLADAALLAAPTLRRSGKALIFTAEGAPEIRLETDQRDDRVYVRINGHEAMVTEDWVDPFERADEFRRLLDKAFAGEKAASIWRAVLFGETAHAAAPSSPAMDQVKARYEKFMVVVTPHIVKLYDSIKKKSPLCEVSKRANKKGYCCVVGTEYKANATACCYEIGGVLSSSKPFESCSGPAVPSPTTPSTPSSPSSPPPSPPTGGELALPAGVK